MFILSDIMITSCHPSSFCVRDIFFNEPARRYKTSHFILIKERCAANIIMLFDKKERLYAGRHDERTVQIYMRPVNE